MLHIFAAFLLFILLKNLFNNRLLALCTSALFLVHPLQTESITYVSGISDPLSAILIFLSLIYYLKFRETNSRVVCLRSSAFHVSLAAFVLCFLARETTVFFLGFLVLAELILHIKKYKKILWPRFFVDSTRYLWPYALCTVFYVLLRLSVLNFQNTLNLYDKQNEFTTNPIVRLLTFFRILTVYVQLLFWPVNLHMERTVELAATLWKPDVLIGASVLISSISALIFFLKRNRLVVFSISWVLIGLFPTSNILVPINGLLFEHWLYLPMIGVWLLLCSCFIRISRIANGKLSKLFAISYLLFAIFLSIRTIQQNRLWGNPITFYNYTLKFAPTSYRLLNNLGMAYAEKGDHENAIRVYQSAISVNPENAVAYHNLGNTHKTLGDKQKAIEAFEKAISLQPDFYFSYNALADLYFKEKNIKSAVEVLNTLYKIQPSQQLLQLIKELESQK